MTTNAGQLTTTVQANPQWVLCSGQPLYVLDPKQPATRPHTAPQTGDRRDYARNVGWQGRRRGLGPMGWIILMPYDAGGTYKVSTAGDNTETALTPPVYTVGNVPPGSGIK